MKVTATTIPTSSQRMTVNTLDENDGLSDDEEAVFEHKKVLRSMLEKLEIPKASPFTLSFGGRFSGLFRLNVQGSHVQLVLGSGVVPADAVVRLLLNY